MKVILAGPYPAGTLEQFKTLLPEHEILPVTKQEEYEAMTEGECIIVRVLKTPASVMETKQDLKAVIRWGAGYDSVDIEAAGKLGVQVANMPGVNAYAVSELAVALMLAAGRKIMDQNRLTHDGIWNNKLYSEKMMTLNHKTVGIIGGGNIGRRVASQVRGFGAQVLYYDAFRLKEEQEREFHMTYVPLEELIRKADVITLHVPLLDSTRHMIGEAQLASMKDGVILVNTARGGLIDDAALAKALASGKVAAAGLDCVEEEALDKNPLAGMQNVILTPHIGGTSNDLAEEMVPRIAEQVKRLGESGEVKNVVNMQFLCKRYQEKILCRT